MSWSKYIMNEPTVPVMLTNTGIIEIQCALKQHWQPDEKAPFTDKQKVWCNRLMRELDEAKVRP